MIIITPAAQRQLLQLIADHPEDPVVRVSIKDLDHERISFSITLEAVPRPDDAVQNLDGLQVAVEGSSATRMDGMTIDYAEPDGFRFVHPGSVEQSKLRVINLN
jgi:Fe-S cluster assembly iron-binding protein IscA